MRATGSEYDGRRIQGGSHSGLLFPLLASIPAGYLCLFKRNVEVGYGVINKAERKLLFLAVGVWSRHGHVAVVVPTTVFQINSQSSPPNFEL